MTTSKKRLMKVGFQHSKHEKWARARLITELQNKSTSAAIKWIFSDRKYVNDSRLTQMYPKDGREGLK